MTADYTERENVLKARVVERLSPDFYLRPEQAGVDLVHGESLRPDFLLWPRLPLAAIGYPEQIVPVEVKYISPDDIGALVKVCWQGITYQQARYPSALRGDMRPLFTMLYLDSEYPDIIADEANRRSWNVLARLLQRANVGFLDASSPGNVWRFMFANQPFCGRNNAGLFLSSVENLGLKIHVGNCETGRGITTRYM